MSSTLFVDNITLASKSKDTLNSFVVELQKHFKLRDLGETIFLLGVAITRDRPNKKLYLSQKKYILNKLDEFKMADCKPGKHLYFLDKSFLQSKVQRLQRKRQR